MSTVHPSETNAFRASGLRLFEAVPAICLALSGDEDFTVLAATDEFLSTFGRRRDEIVGCKFLDAFPYDPANPGTAAVPHVRDSLERVVRYRAPHALAAQRYDLPGPDGRLEARYWAVDNRPVFAPGGHVEYILQRSEDVTDLLPLQPGEARFSRGSENLRPRVIQMATGASVPAASRSGIATSGEGEALRGTLRALTSAWHRETRLLHRALSATQDHAFVMDAQLRFIYANDALLSLWGRSAEQALGRTCAELAYSPEAERALEAGVRHVFETGTTLRDESIYANATGAERCIEYSLAPVRAPDGRVEAVAGSGRDITERRKRDATRQALLALGDRLRAARSADEIASAAAELVGGTLGAERAGIGTPSCSPGLAEEPQQGGFLAVDDVERDARTAAVAANYVARHVRSFINVPVPDGDGVAGILYVEAATPRVWSRDELGFVREVAERASAALERARTEAALRTSEERFRTLFESMDEGFCVIEMLFDEHGRASDYRFVELNPAFEKHSGFKGAAGRTVREMGLDVEPEWFERYGRVAVTGQAIRFVNQAKSANGRWFDVYAFRPGTAESGRIAILFKDITAQRRTEEAARQNEARWREIFERLHEGFLVGEVIYDAAGRAVDWRHVEMNAAWERLTGLTRAAALGRTIREVIPTVERAWIEDLARVVETGVPANAEMASAALGRWYATHTFPSEPGRFACIFRDVTERRRAEEAKRQSDERLAEVFRRAPSFMCILQGPDHVFERANDRYNELVGHRAIVGKPLREALPELEGQGFLELLDTVYRSGEPWSGTDVPVSLQARPDAPPEQHFVDFVYQPLRDAHGAVSGILAQGIDLTDRKRAEAALRESEARLRLIMANVKDHAIFTLDLEGRVTSWNVGAERVFGFTEEEMLGRTTENLFTDEDRANDRARVELELTKHAGIAEDTRSHVKKDGKIFFSSGSMEGLRDEDGRLRGYVKVVRDVTERKRLEEEQARLLASERSARAEAERASSLKDDFLATLSHELRTPLNAILGWSQILARRGTDQSKSLDQGLGVIERNARAQAQLIEDLLDMSRIISGKVRLHAQYIALADVVEAALASARPSAEAKDIALTSSVSVSDGSVWADPERLQQVFWNLLTNAIKFTPRAGRIAISVEHSSSRLHVRVTDTGKGIAPEFVPYVFDRFRQADASTTRLHGGLGIGLSIVKNLVELHGGTVSVSSAGEGRGATFVVSLPIPALVSSRVPDLLHAPAPERSEATQYEERLDGVTVLVVDDEADARDLVAYVLAGCGATVLCAGSAGEALVILRGARVDVLLSDVGMPHEDGYALIRRVRALPEGEGARVPAAALTAFARTEDRQRALRAGFQIHVTKPVDPAELVTVVATLAKNAPRPSS